MEYKSNKSAVQRTFLGTPPQPTQGLFCNQGPTCSPPPRVCSPSSPAPRTAPPALLSGRQLPAQAHARPPGHLSARPASMGRVPPLTPSSAGPHHPRWDAEAPRTAPHPDEHVAHGLLQNTRPAPSPATAARCTEQGRMLGRRMISFHATHTGHYRPSPTRTHACAHTHVHAHRCSCTA